MSGKTIKEIKKLVKGLPEIPEEIEVRRTGKELLAKNPNATDSIGQPLLEGKIYVIKEVRIVNHYKYAMEAYEKDGMDGLVDYNKQVLEYYHNSLKNMPDENVDNKL